METGCEEVPMPTVPKIWIWKIFVSVGFFFYLEPSGLWGFRLDNLSGSGLWVKVIGAIFLLFFFFKFCRCSKVVLCGVCLYSE